MSIIAEIKYEALVETLQKDFGYQGSSKQKSKSTKTTAARSSTTERSRRTAALLGGQPVVTTKGEQLKVQNIRIDTQSIKGGLVRFALGSDELTEQAKKDLTVMKSVLLGSPFKIMIKGHVAPNEQGMYQKDIDLAYARAVNVRDFLMTLGFKQEFFEISVVDASATLNKAILPAGTDPKLAGASAEVMLIDKTLRALNN